MCFCFTVRDAEAERVGDFQARGRLVAQVWACCQAGPPVSPGRCLNALSLCSPVYRWWVITEPGSRGHCEASVEKCE